MARRTKRNRPTSPAEILARNALQRGLRATQERRTRGNPEMWGLPEGLELRPANEDLVVVRDPQRHAKILRARRSDVFALVTLSDAQERASARYVKDWMIRAGVGTHDPLQAVMVDSSGAGWCAEDFKIDAGRRIEEAHGEIGRAGARLLEALVEPMAMRGEIRVWRVTVEKLTGETERHAQAGRVRQACEDLHLAYEVIDERARTKAKRARVQAPYAGGGEAS